MLNLSAVNLVKGEIYARIFHKGRLFNVAYSAVFGHLCCYYY